MSGRTRFRGIAVLGLLLLAGVGGCQGSFVGYIDVSVTDTPVQGVASVVVAFTGVDIGTKGGETDLPFGLELPVDLLTAQGLTSAQIVSTVIVPAGDYTWLRLDVDPANSYVITTGGGRYPLSLPRHLTLAAPFTIGEDLHTGIMVEFNLMQSLARGPGGTTYLLGPGVRAVQLATAGNVAGFVPNTLIIGGTSVASPSCSPAVYAYPGSGAVPEGYDVPVPGGTEPYSSGPATLSSNGLYRFVIGYLPDGPYTFAVACAANDTPTTATLPFSPTQDATVTAGHLTVISF